MREAVEPLPAGLRMRVHEALELGEGAPVHLALELDDRVERHPVIVPTPGIEFRPFACAQGHVGVAPDDYPTAVRAIYAAFVTGAK